MTRAAGEGLPEQPSQEQPAFRTVIIPWPISKQGMQPGDIILEVFFWRGTRSASFMCSQEPSTQEVQAFIDTLDVATEDSWLRTWNVDEVMWDITRRWHGSARLAAHDRLTAEYWRNIHRSAGSPPLPANWTDLYRQHPDWDLRRLGPPGNGTIYPVDGGAQGSARKGA